MANSTSVSPILQQGIGQPYLAIFDSKGMPIKNVLTGIPFGVYITRWYFEYNEETENLSIINLDVADPDTVDVEELHEGSIIYLQWGYIFPNGEFLSSPVRVIKVRDFDCIFDDQGTHITIKCVDGAGDLRYYPPYSFSEIPEYSFSTLLNGGCNNSVGVIIEEFSYE